MCIFSALILKKEKSRQGKSDIANYIFQKFIVLGSRSGTQRRDNEIFEKKVDEKFNFICKFDFVRSGSLSERDISRTKFIGRYYCLF